jgi:hypothetical protein
VYVAFTTFSWRSYLSLTRNFKHSWPRRDARLPTWEAGLYQQLGLRLLGEQYDPAAGVARNLDRRLRPDIAEIPDHLAADPDVLHFATCNAGYSSGDVLLCLAPLSLANWWSAARRMMLRRRRARGARKPGHPLSPGHVSEACLVTGPDDEHLQHTRRVL